jgi:hypothetical protein
MLQPEFADAVTADGTLHQDKHLHFNMASADTIPSERHVRAQFVAFGPGKVHNTTHLP